MDPVNYIQNCFRAIRNWFRHNTVLISSTLFISGLVWSTMMEKTFLRILITSGGNLPSVVVVNLHQGITSVFTLVFTYATGGCLLRFLVVVFSSTVSIFGVIHYMLVAAGNDDKEQLQLWSFYVAMVVMASAQAALTAMLKEALDDIFRPTYQNNYQRQRLTKLLWSPVSLMAAKFAPLEPLTGLHFDKLALVLITMMLCLLCVFLFSSFSYNHFAMTTGNVRATEEADNRRPVNLLSLWVCLLILSLVSASASTFFFLEASTFSGRNYLSAILSQDNLLRFTEASFRGMQQHNQEKIELLRIGIALTYSVICCTLAMPMSVYWLTPQFFILGLMVGLAKGGFQSLYESRVPPHLKRYGSVLGELARGLGGILSILCIFVFRGRDISWSENDSSFNTYCIFRPVLSSLSLMLFLVVVVLFMGGCILLDDDEIYEHLE